MEQENGQVIVSPLTEGFHYNFKTISDMRLVFSSYSAKGLLPSRMGMSGRGKANPTDKEGLYHIRVLGVTSLE